MAKKIREQKKLLSEDAEDKKKQLIKLWSYRSQTLPTYKHPLTVKLEEELTLKNQQNEDDKKKRECNDLEKRNYQPPKVVQNEKLKIQREIRKDKIDRESVIKTELNNKKRLDKFKFTPIASPKNLKIIQEELNQEFYLNKCWVVLQDYALKLVKHILKSMMPLEFIMHWLRCLP